MMAARMPPIHADSLQLPQESVGSALTGASDLSVGHDTSNSFRISDQGADALNEYLIDRTYRLMMKTTDVAVQRHWFGRMAHYIKRRSPERVAQMEAAKGLA